MFPWALFGLIAVGGITTSAGGICSQAVSADCMLVWRPAMLTLVLMQSLLLLEAPSCQQSPQECPMRQLSFRSPL